MLILKALSAWQDCEGAQRWTNDRQEARADIAISPSPGTAVSQPSAFQEGKPGN